MNKYFKMIHTGGPYQDTTSSYSLEIAPNSNLNDVLSQIVQENEWGEVVLWVVDPKLKDVPYLTENEKMTNIVIRYSDRKLEFKKGHDLYFNINKIVPCTDKHFAKGSYGNMNFTFYI